MAKGDRLRAVVALRVPEQARAGERLDPHLAIERIGAVMIRQSVIDRWHEFSEPLEGRVNSMYLDVKGLVTTCVGNLIDTP